MKLQSTFTRISLKMTFKHINFNIWIFNEIRNKLTGKGDKLVQNESLQKICKVHRKRAKKQWKIREITVEFQEITISWYRKTGKKIHIIRKLRHIHLLSYMGIAPDKRGYSHNTFLISPQKHMLWVLIGSASSSEYTWHMFSWRNKKNIRAQLFKTNDVVS